MLTQEVPQYPAITVSALPHGARARDAARWSIGPATVIAAIIAALAMLSAATLSTLAVQRQREATSLTERTQDVLGSIARLTTATVEAETGQRGYLLTGNEAQLQPYYAAILSIDRETGGLRELSGRDPARLADIERISGVIDQHLDLLRQSINARRLGQLTGSDAAAAASRGKTLQDRIRAELTLLSGRERDQLRARQNALEDESAIAARYVTLSGIMAVLAVIAVALASHHDARKRGREIALAWEEATTARDHAETLAVQMRHAALHDALTGLRNRRAFDHDLASELTRAARHAHPVTVAVIDLDGLKRVNDGRGHARGDELLCALTREMQQRLRGEDHLYRTGGDEFAAILPHAATSAAHELLARLRAATDAVREAGFPEAGASIGLATFPDEARDSFALLKLADDRMYRDKAAHYAAQG